MADRSARFASATSGLQLAWKHLMVGTPSKRTWQSRFPAFAL
jgi:hypothetical protein